MPNDKELLDILLANRGIKNEDRDKFLNPSYENDLYDPFLLSGMDLACKRIKSAIDKKEKIIIYSDYDSDGIPAAVMMHDLFEKINYQNFKVYIPDRHDEGYGLHIDAIEEFAKDNTNLIITFDLGITAIDEVERAKELGMDVIITDHHLPKEMVPKAYCIIDPKLENSKYPIDFLCGAGVAFKLIQALISLYKQDWKIHDGWEKWLLDMASIATLSDQVPLVDENRTLAYFGLKVLKKAKRPGLSEIFTNGGVDMKNLSEDDIVFTLTPRINAASRMSDPKIAFSVLSTKDHKEAKTRALELIKINEDRKHNVATIMKEVKSSLLKRNLENENPFIVIGSPKWRPGVLGLVAAKITEEYKKCAFVWGNDGDNVIKGSCRSFGNINIFDVMSSLPENSLDNFGGHAFAGGFSVSYEEIHFLEDRLFETYNKQKNNNEDDSKTPDYKIDTEFSLDDVNIKNYKIIELLAPYGLMNPKPVFLFKNLTINSVKEFGKEKNHLELIFKNDKHQVKAISFFKTRDSFDTELKKDGKINLVANVEMNNWQGKRELRLRIIDIFPTSRTCGKTGDNYLSS